ncbi:hypothetical protein [Streptomyces sp. NPDC087859]|uniref:hypothetical protein n=1 Tax=Streptomyces sp. NPDC087859 TaxID=3365812 RepID=UPI0037FF2B2E
MAHPSTELPTHAREEQDTGGPAAFGRRSITLYVIAYSGLYLAVMTPLLVSLAIRSRTSTRTARPAASAWWSVWERRRASWPVWIVGVRSHKTSSPSGGRKPWMLGGVPVVLLGAVVTGTDSSVAVVMAGSVISHLRLSASMTPLHAFLPDRSVASPSAPDVTRIWGGPGPAAS